MSSYVRVPDNVEAIQTSATTGTLTLNLADGTTLTTVEGGWIVQHSDGHVEAIDDATFQADYTAAPAPEPAPAP